MTAQFSPAEQAYVVLHAPRGYAAVLDNVSPAALKFRQHKEDNAHWLAPQDAIDQVNPIPADNESVELGRKLYVELCSRCHGESALGDGPDASSLSTQPTDLKAMSGGHTDGDFAWKIRTGRKDMPAWGEDLDVDETWHLVNFIQS